MFRNFWVGSDGEFVFYSHIYFSFFDCEVKRFNFRFLIKEKWMVGGGGGVEGDSQANTYYQQTKETVKQI